MEEESDSTEIVAGLHDIGPHIDGVKDMSAVLVPSMSSVYTFPAICGRLSTTSTDLPAAFASRASTAP